MNAVNLMPAGARRARPTISAGRPFLGLVAGLALLLLATVLYVSAHDRVTSRQAELVALNAATARWSAAAAAYDRSVQTLSVHSRTDTDVRALVAARYHWSVLLAEVAGRMPARAALTSLQASAPLAADPSPSDGIQISGCAAAQSVVAETMDSLRSITGVSNVTLTSSSKGGGGVAVGSCTLPVQFQIALYFASGGSASSSTAATIASDTTAAGSAQ
jgi:Tfp pilus assembly protein PilN